MFVEQLIGNYVFETVNNLKICFWNDPYVSVSICVVIDRIMGSIIGKLHSA